MIVGRLEIINPIVTVVSVNDFISEKICNIEIILTSAGVKYHHTMTGFTYEETWEDVDIINWVNEQLN